MNAPDFVLIPSDRPGRLIGTEICFGIAVLIRGLYVGVKGFEVLVRKLRLIIPQFVIRLVQNRRKPRVSLIIELHNPGIDEIELLLCSRRGSERVVHIFGFLIRIVRALVHNQVGENHAARIIGIMHAVDVPVRTGSVSVDNRFLPPFPHNRTASR